MRTPRVELLVFDVHGVILNAYWPRFLREIARHTNEAAEQVIERWHRSVRADAWTGKIDDAELWRRLIPSAAPTSKWREALEAGYVPGPAAPHLRKWAARRPIWLLSNHRSDWLLPRLVRFDVNDCIDRVIVSDASGAAKPDPAAFHEILNGAISPRHILFVDDQARNVDVARDLGMTALRAEPEGDWIARVDDALGSAPPRAISSSAGGRRRAARIHE